jgi:glutamate carboxypeptidase
MMVDEHIIRFLKAHEADMFALLKALVMTPSGSQNKRGVDRVSQQIEACLQTNRVNCTRVPQEIYGDHLVVRTGAQRFGENQVLMVGHMDTVFPATPEYEWFREDEARIYGPGVIDMKGGLVAGIYAIKALDSVGLLSTIPLTFVFNSDEEVGSVTSRELIRSEAETSVFALVLECGGEGGGIVTGRKGNAVFKVDIRGEAGHAAFAGPHKASAILELAHKIAALELLNDPGRGVTVNVGRIDGGIGANTVADRALAWIDCRFIHPEDGEALFARLQEIVDAGIVKGTTSSCDILTQRSAMPDSQANKALFGTIKRIADQLGIPVVEEHRLGVSDANIVAETHTPVVDGLGPLGEKDHSKDEFMVKPTLLERSMLIAATLAEGWQIYGVGTASTTESL